MIYESAPAKINLFLHITGKRADGYHLLDSLVAFAHKGSAASDKVTLEKADAFGLAVTGPYAGILQGEDPHKNLISKAFAYYTKASGAAVLYKVVLEKNLPVASGIGGGSADAGAALRALAKLENRAADDAALVAAARSFGSDGLVCYYRKPAMMRGVGDEIEFLPSVPSLSLLLVNPNVPLATAPVYGARTGAFSAPVNMKQMPTTPAAFCAWLQQQTNDLEAPARHLCPVINDVLAALNAQKGCGLARLSGSGATCFGLFENEVDAQAAAAAISKAQPNWWVAVSGI